jgi:hypothetical protein
MLNSWIAFLATNFLFNRGCVINCVLMHMWWLCAASSGRCENVVSHTSHSKPACTFLFLSVSLSLFLFLSLVVSVFLCLAVSLSLFFCLSLTLCTHLGEKWECSQSCQSIYIHYPLFLSALFFSLFFWLYLCLSVSLYLYVYLLFLAPVIKLYYKIKKTMSVLSCINISLSYIKTSLVARDIYQYKYVLII